MYVYIEEMMEQFCEIETCKFKMSMHTIVYKSNVI